MIFLLLACTGASKDTSSSDDSASGELTLSHDIQPIFNQNCVPCHSGDNPSSELDMSEGKAMVYLQQVSVQVPTMVRLEPGSLESSYLWYKILGTHKDAGGFGTSMPPQIPLLSEDQDQIGAWIEAGAEP